MEELLSILKSKRIMLRACSEDEVEKLEKFYNIKLPQVYRTFLLSMGKGAGSFMKGSSCFYDEIFELKDWADELLMENNYKHLPDNVFVFWMHQGYQFCFFYLNEGDNPGIYYFSETNKKQDFERKHNTLIDFLKVQLKASEILE